MEFFLRKAGHPNLQVRTVPDGPVAEFPIPSVTQEDGGSYTCDYHSITDQSHWLYLSDPVKIIVAGSVELTTGVLVAPLTGPHCPIMVSALTILLLGCWLAGHSWARGEPSYPKPNISLLSPSWGVSLGGAVTVQCCGQHESLQFVLNKEGRHVQTVNSDFLALFLINNLSREDGGSYNCSYHSQSKPFTVSDPSDPVELVVRDPSLPRPSISLSPTWVTAPGANVTIRCQGQRGDVRFFLHKAGDLNPQQHMGPAGNMAEFHILNVSRQHGGNYSCSYRPQSQPFVSSLPSNTVDIFAAGEGSSSVSRLPAPPPAGPTGGLCTDGTLRTRVCPEPWARQRGHSVVDLGCWIGTSDLAHHRWGERSSRRPPPASPPCGLRLFQKNPSQ
ncbi:T-cell-interacting, activating receptor on myeloid cells protein 1-like [Mauremys reevesii]|uniref:T-cell-interacting, activating receptor on myeloid cells protein 1-like n=1 Tax=Mauremys reevesii TaxID=260615 RepID=UPI00193F3E39|nr:T-cell-interacting, activating receptor on myeloid cells protein 1-like [Mauremys reevesii]